MSRNARSRMGRAVRAAPSFSLDFTAGILDPRLTFSRASSATRINESGLLETVGTGAPRFDYDPVTLACRGLLCEDARTNLAATSRDVVAGNGVSVATNAVGADGAANVAFTVTESSTSSIQSTTTTGSASYTSGTTYTLSRLIKPGSATKCQMSGPSAVFGSVQYANFELAGAGRVLASSGVAATIRPHGNGFYLCSITLAATATAVGNYGAVVFIAADADTRLPVITGTNRTLIVDHMQVEVGAFPTSIIPTTGAAATRALDNGIAIPVEPWYSPAGGTFIAEIFTANGADQQVCGVFNDVQANSVRMRKAGNNQPIAVHRINAATLDMNAGSMVTDQVLLRLGYSMGARGRLYSYNGANPVSQPPLPSYGLMTHFFFGGNATIGAAMQTGHLRKFDYYPVPVAAAELAQLTSLTYPPRRAQPDFSLHFLDGVLDSRITFTRASSGTRIDATGTLATAATNVPRFDYDPITLACRGLLLEEARTNLCPQSSGITSGITTETAALAVTRVNNRTGIDGVANSETTLTEDVGTASHGIFSAAINYTSGTTYALSVVVTALTAARVQLTAGSAAFGGAQYANFGLTGAGSVLASSGVTAAITPLGNSRYRCSIALAATASVSGPQCIIAFINSDTATRLPSYTGSGTLTLGIQCLQAEAGSFPTSIIPTTGAAATRAWDTVLVTGASFSSVYNATQGTLAAEFIRTNGDSGSGSPGIFQADGGSSNNRVALRLNSRLANAASQGTVVVGGAVITNTGSVSSAIQGGVIRATMSYSAAGGNTNVAGGTPGPYTLTELPTACTQFAIGGGGGSLGATALSGHIRHIDYYRQALPADFITELSR